MTREEIKRFQNPKGAWSYKGAFGVELTASASANLGSPPNGTTLDGNTLCVREGNVSRVKGGVEMYWQGKPYRWDYKDVITVQDARGQLIWVNDDYR